MKPSRGISAAQWWHHEPVRRAPAATISEIDFGGIEGRAMGASERTRATKRRLWVRPGTRLVVTESCSRIEMPRRAEASFWASWRRARRPGVVDPGTALLRASPLTTRCTAIVSSSGPTSLQHASLAVAVLHAAKARRRTSNALGCWLIACAKQSLRLGHSSQEYIPLPFLQVVSRCAGSSGRSMESRVFGRRVESFCAGHTVSTLPPSPPWESPLVSVRLQHSPSLVPTRDSQFHRALRPSRHRRGHLDLGLTPLLPFASASSALSC